MTVKGINNKPYTDVSNYVDMDKFSLLHPEICSGFVLAKQLVTLGMLYAEEEDQKFVNLDVYEDGLKPVWYMYNKYLALPDNDPLKIAGSKFEDNDLILYLTYALGAHNPYKIYTLFNFAEGWKNDPTLRSYSPEHIYFPSVVEWVNNLKIFSHIGRAYFLILDAGGTSIEHCDPKQNGLNEFIHIRSDLDRPFYIRDMDTSEKIYINTKAAYFNDQDYHGGDPISKSTYVLRIDGIFTEEFKNILWG